MSPPAHQRAERIARDVRIAPHVAPQPRGADGAARHPYLPAKHIRLSSPQFLTGENIAELESSANPQAGKPALPAADAKVLLSASIRVIRGQAPRSAIRKLEVPQSGRVSVLANPIVFLHSTIEMAMVGSQDRRQPTRHGPDP